MAPITGKILRIPETPKTPKLEAPGKFRVAAEIRGVESSAVKITEGVPASSPEMKIIPDLNAPKTASTVLHLDTPPVLANPRTIAGPLPKPVTLLLAAMGLGTFFLEPQILTWLTSHLGPLLGVIGLPILGMVIGGGKKDGSSSDGIERFQNLDHYLQAVEGLEKQEGPPRTLSFVGDSEAGYVDRIYTSGVVTQGYEAISIEVGSEVYSYEADSESAQAEGRWSIGATGPDQVAGYELYAQDSRGQSQTVNVATTDRTVIEQIHQQLASEIARTGSVHAAFDWLVNRSSFGRDLFEISETVRTEWAALVLPEFRGVFTFTELKKGESATSGPIPLFRISAHTFDEYLEQIHYPGEWWTFVQSRDLGNGQFEAIFSRPLNLRQDIRQSVYFSEEKVRLLGVHPDSKPHRIYRMTVLPPPNFYKIEEVLTSAQLRLGTLSSHSVYADLEGGRNLGNGLYEVTFRSRKMKADPTSPRGFTSSREKITLIFTRDEVIKYDLPPRPTPGRVFRLSPTKHGEAGILPTFQESPHSVNDPLYTRGTLTIDGRTVEIDVITLVPMGFPDRADRHILIARENGKEYKLYINTRDRDQAEEIHAKFIEKLKEVGSAQYALNWMAHSSEWARELIVSWEIDWGYFSLK